uniref:Uncharacterized protein n=1 Tax=Vannella robusta TaxID=1487602 RepID=A0A7S4MRQ7_9EUKA|mmetsp:Transcript_8047/g.9986  ORF Transcript_8047/g.9986 Transcript_8047/m.9986 type:complete len:462 (+) Transcript_8047:149-1534(+)
MDQLPFASPTLQLLQQEKALGIKAHRSKSWEQAEKYFSHALELASQSYPEHLPCLYSALGLVHFHLKNYSKAIEYCTCSLKHSSSHWPAYLCRSFANSCLKNLTLAASDYDKAATLLQSSSIDEKDLNRILQRAQEAALDSGSVKQKDRRLDVLEELGDLYFKTDISPKDQSAYDEMPLLTPVGVPLGNCAWNSNPDDFSSSECNKKAMEAKEMGNSAFNAKDWISALTHYSRAIRLNPNNAVFYSNRACVYLKLRRYYETISDCTASIEREPNIKAYARRGAARAGLSEHHLACGDYIAALQFEPQNQSCLQELARCLCSMEREIVQRIEKLEKESNSSATELLQLKKQLLFIRKDISNVGGRLKEPTKEKQQTSEQNSSISPDKQIAEASKVLSKDNCNSVAYLERALAHQALGNYERAEKDYRDGLRVDPDNKELQKRLKFVLQLSRMSKGQQQGTKD